MALGHRC